MKNIKTDVNKLEDFGTGAKRENKSGKGRYDLIPSDAMVFFENAAIELFAPNEGLTVVTQSIGRCAYDINYDKCIEGDINGFCEDCTTFIAAMVVTFFCNAEDKSYCSEEHGLNTVTVNYGSFQKGVYNMRKALAKHYEDGAEIHGVDNWKKGIRISGGDRGGTFIDSMRRHTDQALMGLTDEPHAVAAIWNAFGAMWTAMHYIDIFKEREGKTKSFVDKIYKVEKNNKARRDDSVDARVSLLNNKSDKLADLIL